MSKTKKNTHYTIWGGEREDHEVYVPGHDIGNGWKRHIIELQRGETADNPSSTKRTLYGPGFIVYDVAPSGIRTTEYDHAGQWYKALADTTVADVETRLRTDGRLLGDDPIDVE